MIYYKTTILVVIVAIFIESCCLIFALFIFLNFKVETYAAFFQKWHLMSGDKLDTISFSRFKILHVCSVHKMNVCDAVLFKSFHY